MSQCRAMLAIVPSGVVAFPGGGMHWFSDSLIQMNCSARFLFHIFRSVGFAHDRRGFDKVFLFCRLFSKGLARQAVTTNSERGP